MPDRFRRFGQDIHNSRLIPVFICEDTKWTGHAFVVNGAPQGVYLAVDPDEHLRQMLEPYAENLRVRF